tara:strand:+ start:517 stop:1149 length:633 start_codon:yes stop_codon:yes gene_type:complete
MKMTERYLWIAGLILAGFVIQNQSNNNATLQTLLAAYDVESTIQNAQISDFNTQLSVVRAESHSQGFEEGKTQAGIALARGESLYDYTDGYHAAIGQNIEEADVLEISEGIFKELTTLRKMVPRLLNQVTQITTEKEELKASQDYAVSLLLETLDEEETVESSYLNILEILLAEDSPPEVVVEDFVPNLPRLDNRRLVIEEQEVVREDEE